MDIFAVVVVVVVESSGGGDDGWWSVHRDAVGVLVFVAVLVTSCATNPPRSVQPQAAAKSAVGVTTCGTGDEAHSRLWLSQDLHKTFNSKLRVILVVYGGSKLGAK